MIRLLQLTSVILLGIFFSPLNSPIQLPSQEIIERASLSVVNVQARGSVDNKMRTATGFLWGNRGQVVTTLHVVSGCDQIFVYSENARARRRARIHRVLKDADLALLQVIDAFDLPGLSATTSPPRLHDDLVALGYELGTPSMGSKNLKLSFGRTQLIEMLPPDAKEKVRRSGSPSLSLRVFRLQGHLVPGLSGAPLIDRTGCVAAIGDGGLESGAVSISWALPVENIQRLLNSSENVNTIVASVTELYSAELDASPGDTFSCGNMIFKKMRTRTYSQLATINDDPASMDNIRQIAEIADLNVSQLAFDVYVHSDSGATVVLPHDLQLTRHGEIAFASEFNNKLYFCVGGISSIDYVLDKFEIDASIYTADLEWTRDPNFSYPTQHTRFDGLTIDRASYIGRDPSLDLIALLEGRINQSAIACETAMSRSNTYTQVVVFTFDPQMLDPTSTFMAAFLEDPVFMNKIRRWVEMILGAYLSTFPIG